MILYRLDFSFMVCLLSISVFGGNFFNGYIITKTGEVKNGSIEMFYGTDKDITFKANNKEVKYKSIALKEIGLYDPETKDTIVYNRYNYASFGWGKSPKLLKDEIWAYSVFTSDKIEAFHSPSPQVVHGGGGSIRSWQMFTVYVKLADMKHIVHIFDVDEGTPDPFHAYDKQMRKQFSVVIEDKCPAMVTKIREKKYNTEDFIKMLDDFTALCK
jgi:hypothetical protein